MILDVNVLHPTIHHLILSKMKHNEDWHLTITMKIDTLLQQSRVSEKIVQQNYFLRWLWCCNIFSFYGWEKDAFLKCWSPTSATICKNENIFSHWFFLSKSSSWSTSIYYKSDLALIVMTSNNKPCRVETLRYLRIHFSAFQCTLYGLDMLSVHFIYNKCYIRSCAYNQIHETTHCTFIRNRRHQDFFNHICRTLRCWK